MKHSVKQNIWPLIGPGHDFGIPSASRQGSSEICAVLLEPLPLTYRLYGKKCLRPIIKQRAPAVHSDSYDDFKYIWASTLENLLWGFANNTAADQSVHPHSLISAFDVRLLESIISRLLTSEISIF